MNPSVLVTIELILKGTAILLAGCGGAVILARSSALHRSFWWLGVFVTMLVLPLALVIPPMWTLRLHVGSPAIVASATPLPVILEADPAARGTASAPPISGWSHFGIQRWLLVAYGSGASVALGFRLLGTWQLWSLRRTAVADAELQFLVDRWRKSSRMRRPVRALNSSRVTVPMTWGTWRPVIVFPKDRREWPVEELHAAMQHELAHIRHCDAARRWLGTMVCAVWWPHPLAWVAVRAWNLEQERACDDAVLNSGGDPATYAQQLLTAARSVRLSRFQTAAALVMAMPAGLEARLRSVVSNAVDRSPVRVRSLLSLGAMTLLAMVCGLAFQAQSVGAPPEAAAAAANSQEKKAAETIIPKMEFREATPREVLEFIAVKADLTIVYRTVPKEAAHLTMSLTNIPASEALRYVASLANLDVKYVDGLVLITTPASKVAGNAITVEMHAPKGSPKPDSVAMARAQKIIIPAVEFRETTISEALDYLRKKAVEADPEKRGVPIILKQGTVSDARITMSLSQVPLDEALRYVTGLASLELHTELNALVIESPKAAAR
jgi:hypothetical protein